MLMRIAVGVLLLPLLSQSGATPAEQARIDEQNATLRTMLAAAPKLPLTAGAVPVQPPSTPGWALGMVSWVAASPDGLTYLLQRGDKADPIVALDRTGKIV